jgi:hypothetical protein
VSRIAQSRCSDGVEIFLFTITNDDSLTMYNLAGFPRAQAAEHVTDVASMRTIAHPMKSIPAPVDNFAPRPGIGVVVEPDPDVDGNFIVESVVEGSVAAMTERVHEVSVWW